jgi:hypothetical protein
MLNNKLKRLNPLLKGILHNIAMFTKLTYIWTDRLIVGEAIPNKRLSFLRYGRIGREVHFRRVKHCLIA